jgi:hypothetical protein
MIVLPFAAQTVLMLARAALPLGVTGALEPPLRVLGLVGAREYCLRGEPRHCAQTKGIMDSFAQTLNAWAKSLVPLPASVGDAEAPRTGHRAGAAMPPSRAGAWPRSPARGGNRLLVSGASAERIGCHRNRGQ